MEIVTGADVDLNDCSPLWIGAKGVICDRCLWNSDERSSQCEYEQCEGEDDGVPEEACALDEDAEAELENPCGSGAETVRRWVATYLGLWEGGGEDVPLGIIRGERERFEIRVS